MTCSSRFTDGQYFHLYGEGTATTVCGATPQRDTQRRRGPLERNQENPDRRIARLVLGLPSKTRTDF